MSLCVEVAVSPDPAWVEARRGAAPGPHCADPWIAYRRRRGLAPRFLRVHDGAEPVAVGVAYVARSRWRPWARPAWSADRLPWPLPGAAPSPKALLEALAAAAREQRAERLEVGSFDGPALEQGFDLPGARESARFEFLLDLGGPDDARFAALKASHRRKVRQAEKADVTIAEETAPATVDLLASLQGFTADRHAHRGEALGLPDARQYRDLAATVVAGGGGRLYVARLGGVPVSCALFGVSGSRAYYLMGGTDEAGLRTNAATLLLWSAACALGRAGVAVLNLGGVPAAAADEAAAEHGLYRFKEGFGGARIPCRSVTLAP